MRVVELPTKRKKRPQRQIKANKTKLKSISKLIKECDAAFSKKVRLIGATQRTYQTLTVEPDNKCFTCKRIYEIKKLQCGHYLSRFYKAARWDFDNARPQCMMCNLWKRGDPIVFRQNLVKEIGLERVEAVEAKRNVSIKLTRDYLESLLASLST